MENLLSVPVVWFIIGFALLLLEFALPGLIIMFFGVGAWVVAIMSLFIDMSINMQLVVFLVASLFSVLLLRKWLQKTLLERKRPREVIESEFIGKTAKAETAISPGQNGKVLFKGSSWQAMSEDIISPGENVTIIDTQSILLIVKSTKTL